MGLDEVGISISALCTRVAPSRAAGAPLPRSIVKSHNSIVKITGEVSLCRRVDAGPQDVFEDDSNVHMVMELCSGGSILESIRSESPRTEADVADIVRCVLRFIAQCHIKVTLPLVQPVFDIVLPADLTGMKADATDFTDVVLPYAGPPGWGGKAVCRRGDGEDALYHRRASLTNVPNLR